MLNPNSLAASAREPRAVQFPHAHRKARVQDANRPAAAVALEEASLLADARRVGLGLDRLAYGNWTTQERLAKQDILRRDR